MTKAIKYNCGTSKTLQKIVQAQLFLFQKNQTIGTAFKEETATFSL